MILFHHLIGRFIHLTGLMAACFLYFNCGFSSKLGMGNQPSSVPNMDTGSIKTDMPINDIDMAIAGRPKEDDLEKIDRDEIYTYTGKTILSIELGKYKGVYTFGHDAVSAKYDNVNTTHQALIAVADGVGRMCSHAPYTFSARMTKHTMESKVDVFCGDQGLIERFKDGYNTTLNDHKANNSSTTFCLVSINGPSLECINLGDSGMVVCREKDIVCQTKLQQKGINSPFQCGKGRDLVRHETPDHCHQIKYDLRSGDCIITATDGFWDNVSKEECIKVINQNLPAKETAEELLELAYKNSKDKEKESPFERSIKEYINKGIYKDRQDELNAGYLQHYKGGKKDDISIVIAIIK